MTSRVAIETPRGQIRAGRVVGEIDATTHGRPQTLLRVAIENHIYRVDADAATTHE